MTTSVIRCLAAALVASWIALPTHVVTEPQRKTIWDRVYTETQAIRGEQIYRQKCTLCHRDNLQGNSADGGPPLRGNVFTNGWHNVSLASLVKIVQELMPADQPGTLTAQQAVDVVTFILWANGAPAGTTELLPDPAALEAITFTEKTDTLRVPR